MLITLVVTQALVSFSGLAEPASRLLPKLGAAIGLPLEAWGRAGQQVLLIDVKGLDRDRLLRLVSETSGGIWEKTPQGQKLTLDSDRLQALWKRETADREAWIGSAIKDQLADADSKPLAVAAQAVGLAALAAIRPGERVVWSTAPTRLQRPALSGLFEIGQSFERFRQRDAQAKAHLNAGYADAADRLNSPISTVLLTARRGLHSSSLGLSMAIFRSDGSVIANKIAELFPSANPTDPGIALSGVIEAPKPAQEWADCATTGKPESDELFAKILRPDQNDPLSFGAGPALQAFATRGNWNVVACLPDGSYDSAARLLSRRLPAEKWAPILTGWGIDLRLDENTLIAAPRFPGHAAEDRADRSRLRQEAEAITINGCLPAIFDQPSGLEADYLTSVDFGYQFELAEDSWRSFANPWWSLTPAQQAESTGPNGTPFTEPFLRAFRRAMENPALSIEPSFGNGINFEPTVLFANLSRNSGEIHAVIQSDEEALIKEPNARIPYSATLPDIASAMNSATSAGRMKNPKTRFWPARTNRLTVNIEIGSDQTIAIRGMIKETVRSLSQPSTYPNLFPALKQAIRNGPGG